MRQIIAAQAEAWNSGSASAWAEGFSADADFINILGIHYQGREEVERRHANLFASIFQGSKLEVTVWKVCPLGDSAAVVETILELRAFKQLPLGISPTLGSDVLRTRMKYVFAKIEDRWVIVSAQNTAIAPMPSLTD